MQHSDQNLHLIIRKCRNGERKAQKALFDALAPRMSAICLRYAGDTEIAKDLLQEGFITLFSKLDSYSGEGSFEGWARKIFVNTALMYLRKNDALRLSEDISQARTLQADSPSAQDRMAYQELLTLIAELPTGFRTVFNMYIVEGYSHKEIAQALGISEATSRSQLLRARALLQDKMKRKEDAR